MRNKGFIEVIEQVSASQTGSCLFSSSHLIIPKCHVFLRYSVAVRIFFRTQSLTFQRYYAHLCVYDLNTNTAANLFILPRFLTFIRISFKTLHNVSRENFNSC
jgi:hypothetical protein